MSLLLTLLLCASPPPAPPPLWETVAPGVELAQAVAEPKPPEASPPPEAAARW
jgi:hypothetical protein